MKVMVVILRPVGRPAVDGSGDIPKTLDQRFCRQRFHAHLGAIRQIGVRRQNHRALRDSPPITHNLLQAPKLQLRIND